MTTGLDLRGANVPLSFNQGDRVAITVDYDTNVSTYTGWEAKLLDRPGGTTLATFSVDSSSAATGVVVFTLAAATTAALTAPLRGVWYVEETVSSGVVHTLISADAFVHPQGARGAISPNTTLTISSATITVAVSSTAAGGLANLDGGSAATTFGGVVLDIDGGDA